MKAWVLHNINDFRAETVEEPSLGRREVLVAVKAAGICGSDIPRIYRTGTYSYPLIPGHEFAGEVVKTGTDANPEWQGKRVGVFPLIPCGECIPCQKKRYEMCRHYSYIGSRRDGAFAEYVAVPVQNLIELPDSTSYEEAAMLEPMAVAVHAIRRFSSPVQGTTAVCGLGTIGLLLVMFLREQGNRRILTIGNKDFQREMAGRMGIEEDCYCDAGQEDVEKWLMEKTDGTGADVFFECVGKNETFQQAISLTAPGGKIILVGNPYSDMSLEKAVYWKILRNQLSVTGTWNSSFTDSGEDDWHYVLERLRGKKVAPAMFISHKFRFHELERGLHIMRDKMEDYGKIMIVP